MISGIDNESFQYNLSKNESVEDEDENNEDQIKEGANKSLYRFKSVAAEVLSSASEYFKERKKVTVDADSTFGQPVANNLQAMEDVLTKEYAKFKIKELLLQCIHLHFPSYQFQDK